MIRELRVSGFRILKDFVWEPKEGLNILVGANSAGKSTVLDAIELVTRGSIRGQSARRSLSSDWFNKDIVDAFFQDFLVDRAIWKEFDKLHFLRQIDITAFSVLLTDWRNHNFAAEHELVLDAGRHLVFRVDKCKWSEIHIVV